MTRWWAEILLFALLISLAFMTDVAAQSNDEAYWQRFRQEMDRQRELLRQQEQQMESQRQIQRQLDELQRRRQPLPPPSAYPNRALYPYPSRPPGIVDPNFFRHLEE